jgi:hypothetical protein
MHHMANNRIVRLLVRLLIMFLAALLATGQVLQPVPAFSNDNILPHGSQEQRPQGPLPRELCGVRVLIGSRPTQLMYVSGGQINLKTPGDVPAEGVEPIQVCVGSVCSATVTMLFSTHIALLTLNGPAYVHMPVWIDVDAPSPYVVSYPCGFWPWNFPGYEFEVLRKGQPLASLPQPPLPFTGRVSLGCSVLARRSAKAFSLLNCYKENHQRRLLYRMRDGYWALYLLLDVHLKARSATEGIRSEHLFDAHRFRLRRGLEVDLVDSSRQSVGRACKSDRKNVRLGSILEKPPKLDRNRKST